MDVAISSEPPLPVTPQLSVERWPNIERRVPIFAPAPLCRLQQSCRLDPAASRKNNRDTVLAIAGGVIWNSHASSFSSPAASSAISSPRAKTKAARPP
jgi:hypothetical protein